jgi:threonine synthase
MAKIRIPMPLRKLTNDTDIVETDAGTLGAAVDQLESQYPGIKDRIVGEDGEIRRFVNVYVNGEDVRFLDNLATALKVMEESGGYGVASEDAEIVDGIKLLAESEGIFAETAGGVVIAGLKKLALAGKIAPDELTVAYITGSGLKTQEAIEDALEIPLHIEPTMASFEEKLGERSIAAAG